MWSRCLQRRSVGRERVTRGARPGHRHGVLLGAIDPLLARQLALLRFREAMDRVGKSSDQPQSAQTLCGFHVWGTAFRIALPPLITTLNSMFLALCFCISSGTWERMRAAIESNVRPSVASPQRLRATTYVS